MKGERGRAVREAPQRIAGFFLSSAAALAALLVLFLAAKNFDRLDGASSLFGYKSATGEAVFLGETFRIPSRLAGDAAAFFSRAFDFNAHFVPSFFLRAARSFALFFGESAREFFAFAGKTLLDFLKIGA